MSKSNKSRPNTVFPIVFNYSNEMPTFKMENSNRIRSNSNYSNNSNEDSIFRKFKAGTGNYSANNMSQPFLEKSNSLSNEIFMANNEAIPIEIDLELLVNFCMHFEKEFLNQINRVVFFVNEHLYIYNSRIKQIKRHLCYLNDKIRQSKLEQKRKKKVEEKLKKYERFHNITGVLQDNLAIKEQEYNNTLELSEELSNPFISDKISLIKLESLYTYQNIYELAIKETYKEINFMEKFISTNIAILNFLYTKYVSFLSKTNTKIINSKEMKIYVSIMKEKKILNLITKELTCFYFEQRYEKLYDLILNENITVSNDTGSFVNDINKTNNLNLINKKILTYLICIKSSSEYAKSLKYNCNKNTQNSMYSININLDSNLSLIRTYKEKLEEIFDSNFSFKYKFGNLTPYKILKESINITTFSNFQIFSFGLLLGFILLLIIIELYFASFFGFRLEYNFNFKSIFPIFRGFFLVCLYLWMLGINIFVWDSNHINYRLSFKFTEACSSLFEVFNRAATLTLLGLVMILFYTLSRSHKLYTLFSHFGDHDSKYFIDTNHDLVDKSNKYSFDKKEVLIWAYNDVFPLFLWFSLLVYLIFPSTMYQDLLNYKGRKYFLNLLLECLLAPLYFVIDLIKLIVDSLRTTILEIDYNYSEEAFFSFFKYFFLMSLNTNEFRHIWFTDQLTSFIGPLRDIEYTFCYISNYKTDVADKFALCHSERLTVLFVGMLPNILRVFQCLRLIISSKSFFPQIINAGKYTFVIVAACLAFYTKQNSDLYFYWWIVAILSTIYSSFWDIKHDFGFLEPNSSNYPLRTKISYKSKYIYYAIIVSNFILRFGWVLTTSPEILENIVYPELSLFIIYGLEIIRRSIWNFIRVEYEHVKLCKDFKVAIDFELPLKLVKDESSNKYNVHDNYEGYLESYEFSYDFTSMHDDSLDEETILDYRNISHNKIDMNNQSKLVDSKVEGNNKNINIKVDDKINSYKNYIMQCSFNENHISHEHEHINNSETNNLKIDTNSNLINYFKNNDNEKSKDKIKIDKKEKKIMKYPTMDIGSFKEIKDDFKSYINYN